MRLAVAAVVLSFTFAAAGAHAAIAPPAGMYKPGKRGHHGGGQEIRPAAKIEELSGSITLKVGQKRSFRNAAQTACQDPKMVRMNVNEKGILTVVGLKQGQTQLFMFGTKGKVPSAEQLKNPRKISVNVTR